jgi:hypothetical protein
MRTRSKTPRQIPFDPSKYIDWSTLDNIHRKTSTDARYLCGGAPEVKYMCACIWFIVALMLMGAIQAKHMETIIGCTFALMLVSVFGFCAGVCASCSKQA